MEFKRHNPTFQDTGIRENRFEIGGGDFVVYDSAGQRDERPGLVHYFDQVSSVIEMRLQLDMQHTQTPICVAHRHTQ